jgi:hypothetical protein
MVVETILQWFLTTDPQKTCCTKTVTGGRPVSTVWQNTLFENPIIASLQNSISPKVCLSLRRFDEEANGR